MELLTKGVFSRVVSFHHSRKICKMLLNRRVANTLTSSWLRVENVGTSAPVSLEKIALAVSTGSPIRLTEDSAKNLARNLTADDRQLLLNEIQQIKGDEAIVQFSGSLANVRWRSTFGRPAKVDHSDPTGRYCVIPSKWLKLKIVTSVPKPTPGQLVHNALYNSIPFIGFGFLDNVIMITAGDYIEASMGVALGISTMAAAALGNAVSDVAGIGSAFYVEMVAMRMGFPAPDMTHEQLELKSSQWSANIGRAFGVAFGCLMGMFPLLFLPHHVKPDEHPAEEPTGAVLPVVKAEATPAAAPPGDPAAAAPVKVTSGTASSTLSGQTVSTTSGSGTPVGTTDSGILAGTCDSGTPPSTPGSDTLPGTCRSAAPPGTPGLLGAAIATAVSAVTSQHPTPAVNPAQPAQSSGAEAS